LPRRAETYIAPSVLSADFAELRPELQSMQTAGADLFHLDVMDAHFVPNLTFGPFIVEAIRRATSLPLDAHLMMQRPDQYVEAFVKAGVDALTIHVEAEADVSDTLEMIRSRGIRCGLSLNPGTSLDGMRDYLPELDLILVMSVQPGFGGQSFQASALDKISELASLRSSEGYDYQISVDGGVNNKTAAACRKAGADILVSGSWLFKSADRAAAVTELRGALVDD
jgi:ribulose-phosphate 3-epimerase